MNSSSPREEVASAISASSAAWTRGEVRIRRRMPGWRWMWCPTQRRSRISLTTAARKGRRENLHLRHNLNLHLVLLHPIRNKRLQHIPLNFFVRSKPLRRLLLRNPGTQMMSSTDPQTFLNKNSPHKPPKPRNILLARHQKLEPLDAKTSYTHGYTVIDKNILNVFSMAAIYSKQSPSPCTNPNAPPYAKSEITYSV